MKWLHSNCQWLRAPPTLSCHDFFAALAVQRNCLLKNHYTSFRVLYLNALYVKGLLLFLFLNHCFSPSVQNISFPTNQVNMHRSFQKTSSIPSFQRADFTLLPSPTWGLRQDSELRSEDDTEILNVLFYQAAITYSTFMISNSIDLHFLNPLLFFSIFTQPFIYISIFFDMFCQLLGPSFGCRLIDLKAGRDSKWPFLLFRGENLICFSC